MQVLFYSIFLVRILIWFQIKSYNGVHTIPTLVYVYTHLYIPTCHLKIWVFCLRDYINLLKLKVHSYQIKPKNVLQISLKDMKNYDFVNLCAEQVV